MRAIIVWIMTSLVSVGSDVRFRLGRPRGTTVRFAPISRFRGGGMPAWREGPVVVSVASVFSVFSVFWVGRVRCSTIGF